MMPPPIPTLLTALAALAAVLAMIWLAQRMARWTGFARRAGAQRTLAVEETLPLDARRRLVLVRCEGRRCLLLTGGSQDLVLGWLP